jgi:DNA-binding NtrC family response regulator
VVVPKEHERLRVLIIDDDRFHGEALSDLLNTRGHEAHFAPSLPEADWLLSLFRFQLALLDYDMPEHSGPEVARELHVRDPQVRPVLMSARRIDLSSVPQVRDLSMPFLPKPIPIDALLQLIGRFAAGTALTLRLSFPVQRYRRPGEDDT